MTVAQRETLLYSKPFWLLPGRRTIKAMAVAEDGRESNVVTRVFTVKEVEDGQPMGDEQKCGDTLVKKQLEPRKNRGPASISFSTERWDAQLNTQSIFYEEEIAEAEKCHYCGCEFALGSEMARFCSQCSKPIPRYSECEPEKVYSGCTGVCSACSSFVPLDSGNCPVCDAIIVPREVEEVSFDADGLKLCDKCRRKSPPEAAACQFCEAVFPLPVMLGQAVPPKLNPAGQVQICSSCDRRCSPEARICDWCGIPLGTAVGQECAICNTTLPPWVSYCAMCGVYFDPPPRLDPRNSDLGAVSSNLPFDQLPQWAETPLPQFDWPDTPRPGKATPVPLKPKFVSKSAQAPPLIKSKESGKLSQKAMLEAPKQSISMVSAGNGFWRKQIVHLVTHNSHLAENDPVYRQQIADLKMGQLIGSEIHFTQNAETLEQRMAILLCFARVDHPDYPSSMEQSVKELYSKITPKGTVFKHSLNL